MILGSTTSTGPGCTIIEACTPAKAPRSSSRIFPPASQTSSAGVPITLSRRPTSSATLAAAIAAPTAIAAMTLWPHACPMAGRESYSAQMAMCSGPLPVRATKAVGRSQMPLSTAKPASESASAVQRADCSSSKATSGLA